MNQTVTSKVYDALIVGAGICGLMAAGQLAAVIDRLDLLLYAGSMSTTLRQDLMEAMLTVSGNSTAAHLNRARVALFLALASPEYLVQR
mgnify:CR=1 FL=1